MLLKVWVVEDACLDKPVPSKNSYLAPPDVEKVTSSPSQTVNVPEPVSVAPEAAVPIKTLTGNGAIVIVYGRLLTLHERPFKTLVVFLINNVVDVKFPGLYVTELVPPIGV